KGAYRETKLLEFRKHFDKIEIVVTNPRFYIDENSAINRSEGTNTSSAILATIKIEAHDEKTGKYLVKVDPVLLSEAIHKVSPYPRPPVPGAPPPPPRFEVGGLSKEKTKYAGIRSFPKNTDVVVEYVFDNPKPMAGGGSEITDVRTVSIKMQHSFIEIPDNDFKSRRDDARVGYFTQQVDDLSSDSWTPYRDVINRWHLVKKDPSAELSEPVEPIVWWIENTTPVEWREVIAKATLEWNSAFEKAGFKNAIEVKVQPDDADWEAGDIRYNVLRWTASPRPPFGGYGPSLANPLTGQIIAADVMLEYSFMKSRWLLEDLYTEGASMDGQLANIPAELFCSAGHVMNNSLLAAKSIVSAAGGADKDIKELKEQSLTWLILHELGHTLGLNHNMKASQQFSATDIHNAELTKGSIIGSVMDYPTLNLAPPGVTQGDYAASRPGDYDDWVIEYGYSTALDDAEAEEVRLSRILSRSTEPALAFGNDADDMRAPGLHIDPRVMIFDMSSDA
ncbi:MAG: zinc-dependent metalloprotease, partial [Gammaproteobacteria bacterium]|nr:zinc-dependent metalloprotease [Gammaproteobacteria bacterium]